DIVESEAVLIARAQQLHPETTFGGDFPSRFRVDGAAAPVQADGHAEPAPAPVATPAPAAQPAAPAAAPVPKPAAAPTKAAPAVKAAPAAKPAAIAAKTEKVFPGELALSFEAAMARV